MIQEKELRIGNLYYTTRNVEILVRGFDTLHKFVMVDAPNNDLDITSKNVNSIIFEDLTSINLADFPVSRFGFGEHNILLLNPSLEKGARFEWEDDKKQIIFTDGNDQIIGFPIRCVHQFQNFFYLLTGKEITF